MLLSCAAKILGQITHHEISKDNSTDQRNSIYLNRVNRNNGTLTSLIRKLKWEIKKYENKLNELCSYDKLHGNK